MAWHTVAPRRTVLAVVHNVTAATRLFDVLDLVATDDRVRVEFTVPGSSAFTEGTAEFLTERGIRVTAWAEAVCRDYDLAIAASLGGNLHSLGAPKIVLPHGMGYNKYLPRNPKSEIRNPKSGSPVFGLSAEWLLDDDGVPVPDVLVLSHGEQRERLKRACPAAVERAFVAGDPCLDRIMASRPLRAVYRKALGVDRERLIVLASTWGADSLFARGTGFPRRFAELPLDDYRTVLLLHPNIAAWHSEWGVRRWLAECERAGITALPPAEGWRAALVAADLVVGDHSSVTFYAAALGTPVLLASAPHHAVAPDSAVGRFLAVAPTLAEGPLEPQFDAAIAGHDPARLAAVTALATAEPGRSAALIRAEFYRLMGLPEPAAAVDVHAVPIPDSAGRRVGTQLVRAELAGTTVTVTRFPGLLPDSGLPEGTHLVVDTDQPTRRSLDLAEIIVVPDAALAQDTLWRLPGCALATGPLPDGAWLVLTRDGDAVRVRGAGRVGASVVHAWLTDGRAPADLPTMSLRLGTSVHTVEFG